MQHITPVCYLIICIYYSFHRFSRLSMVLGSFIHSFLACTNSTKYWCYAESSTLEIDYNTVVINFQSGWFWAVSFVSFLEVLLD